METWMGWVGNGVNTYDTDGTGRADNRDGEHYDTPPPPERRREEVTFLL
jgi:hypothetical protein